MRKVIFLLILANLFLGCSEFYYDPPSAETPQVTSCKDRYDSTPRANNWSHKVKLIRKWEMVSSPRCYSETLSARDDVFFPPFSSQYRGKDIQFSAVNLKTCDTATATGNEALKPKLWIDVAPAFYGSFHIEDGYNQIQYELTLCDQRDAVGKCLTGHDLESGTLHLDIDYTEIWIPEKTVIDPPRC